VTGLGLGVATGGLAGAYQAYEAGWYALVSPDPARWPDRGLDVSHHQGAIDWASVAEQDVHFVWIKATEGGDWVDPRFDENWAEAGRAGLLRGAYHFVTLCRPLDEQAEHVIDTVPREPGTLPVALDLEFGGNCAGRPDPHDFRVALDDLRARLRAHYGQEPVLYTTSDFEAAYLAGYAPDAPRWRRDLLREPVRDTAVWQVRNRARVHGVRGPVDVNVARDVRRLVDADL